MATARQQQAPVPPDQRQDYTTSDFDGVNTQAKRYQIKPSEQAWLENLQPIGAGNLKTVPGVSAVLLAIAETPYYVQGFNLLGNDYLFVATTAGNLYQIGPVNTGTYTKTLVDTAGNGAGKFTACQCAQWENSTIVIIDGVNGYYDWTGGVLTKGTSYAPAGARPAFSTGQAIATFSSRVWVASGRTIYFSNQLGSVVAGSSGLSYNDWTSAAGGLGGSFIMTDETMHSNVTQLYTANNFLYIFGQDSVSVISDVQVVGGVTVYTKTDLSTGVGTSYPDSISNYYRTLWFSNPSGFFGLHGTTAKKGSDDLDGVYPLFNNMSSAPPAIGAAPVVTSGLVTINNILCLAFLVNYADPVAGNRPLLCVYFDGKWFFCSQGTNSGVGALTLICGALVAGQNKMYGLDSSGNLYQLFASASTSVSIIWSTALWDMDEPIRYKQVRKAGLGVVYAATPVNLTTTIDTEYASIEANISGSAAALVFIGTGPISFIGTGAITWLTAGYVFLQGDADNFGRYVGLTHTGTAANTVFTLSALQFNYTSGWGQ